MTTSNHIYAGAAIALAIKQPVLALPLAFASHFVLDALPHYGREGHGGYAEVVKYRLTLIFEAVNLVGIPLLIYLLWGQAWWVWAAALLAISPDFVWVYRFVRYERHGLELPTGRLTHIHIAIQRYERAWGVAVEIPVLVLLVWLVAGLVA